MASAIKLTLTDDVVKGGERRHTMKALIERILTDPSVRDKRPNSSVLGGLFLPWLGLEL